MFDLDQYVAILLTALAASYLLTPLVRRVACRYGVIDLPDPRRLHKRATARGGGLAVVIGVHAACILSLRFYWVSQGAALDTIWWQHFSLASLILVAFGIADDIRGISPLAKLAGQVGAASLMCGSGLRFGAVFGVALPHAIDSALVILWIVGVINAFNLIDGLDGLAVGLAIVAGIGLGGVLLLGKVPGELIVLAALIGACLGFLRYNFHPATIFLGDTGSMFIGFTVGVISLRTVAKDTFFLSFCIPLLVLGVPIFDEILAIWRRSARAWLTRGKDGGLGRKIGIMQPDIEHLHHRLLKAGLSTRRVAVFLCGVNAFFVMCGLLINVFRSHAAGIFLLALLAIVYLMMRQLAVIELRDTGKVILSGLHRPTHATFKALAYPVWDMVAMAGAVALAMWILAGPITGFWHNWFLDLPVWVTPTFSLLAASRVYVTVWTRARVLDLLMLASTLVTGLFLSLGIALLMNPDLWLRALLTALLTAAIGHPLILFVRVFYRLTEECVLYLRNKSEVNPALGGVILYGAGERCQLYLKERGSAKSRSFDGRRIVGLLDDERSLHGQWVYGYQVLGGLKELPGLLSQHHVSEIIILTSLPNGKLEALNDLATERSLKVTEWTFGMQRVLMRSGVEHFGPNSAHLNVIQPPVPSTDAVVPELPDRHLLPKL